MTKSSEYMEKALKAFEQSPVFSGLDSNEQQKILEACSYQILPPNTLLFNQGDPCRTVYFIISGRIKLQEVDPETGRNLVLFLLSEGDIFEVICMLDDGPHSLDAITLDTCEVLSLPIETIHRFIEETPKLNKAILPYLGGQMRQLANLAAELSLTDTATRLQLLLLRHLHGNHSMRIPKLIHDLSHEEIASMIGTVRAVVNRHIQHLKKEGILHTHRKFIAVKNLEALLNKVESKFKLATRNSKNS